MRDSLLTPSLSPHQQSARLYSTSSSFWVAFWGGPLAAILYSALNSYRLRRPLDALAYLAALALFGATLYLLVSGARQPAMLWLTDFLGAPRTTGRVLLHSCALLCWSGFYLMHREQHRSMALFADQAPNPWLPGLACAATGYFANAPLARLLAGSLA